MSPLFKVKDLAKLSTLPVFRISSKEPVIPCHRCAWAWVCKAGGLLALTKKPIISTHLTISVKEFDVLNRAIIRTIIFFRNLSSEHMDHF